MKVLVVGAGGYIGEKFAARATKEFSVEVVDSFEGWKKISFEGFDSVLFAAGIAHRKQTSANRDLYFEINRDRAVSVAEKAKSAGVPHFIYLSSMAIFGKKQGEISSHTKPNPAHNDYYGTSKFEAENALTNLQSARFGVAIVRPPMVYGKNCPGRYRQLEKIAGFLPLVPCNKNKRSVCYIDNLSEILCAIVKNRAAGFFHPQNAKTRSTSDLIVEIRRENGKKTVILGAAILIRACMAIFPPLKTAYASLYYHEMGDLL